MPYDPTKRKPITDLTQFEALVFELRASGVSERDMYRGLRTKLTRAPPTYRQLRNALSVSGADPRPVGKGGVFNSHLLYRVVEDPDTGEIHPQWTKARRVGTSPRYPGFRDDRKREARFERTLVNGHPMVPPGTVDRLVTNQVVGHLFSTAYAMHKYDVIENMASEEILKDLERGSIEGY